MQKTLDLQKINGFGPLLQSYLQRAHPALPSPFLPEKTAIEKAIAHRGEFAHRELLYQVLRQQYQALDIPAVVNHNIELLRNKNSFCITTGHQLTLMGGPLFVTYKILTTVQLAQQYKKLLPAYDFVPVFWMATEDHDREEINHFYAKGEKFTWETTQTGAVGRFSCDGILPLIENFKAQFPGLQSSLTDLFETAYGQPNLAQAMRYLVNALFGKYGVVIIDGDVPELKTVFLPVAEKEIKEKFVHQAVIRQNEKLEKAGFEPAIRPREINLFLHTAKDRKRLDADTNGVRTVDGSSTWTQEEFIAYIKQRPGDISPNVLLRPIYQELILPNLAYVGGPAETEYWLQLDGVFEALRMPVPARILRICATVIQAADAEKMEKTGIPVEFFFGDEDKLTRHFLDQVAAASLDFTNETNGLQQVFEQLAQKAAQVDATLEPAVMAEKARQEKALENIFGRIRKAEKNKHEVDINRLKKLRNLLLPGGKLQERIHTLLDIPEKDMDQFTDKALQLELNKMNLLVL